MNLLTKTSIFGNINDRNLIEPIPTSCGTSDRVYGFY